jgi:hypothetical protein
MTLEMSLDANRSAVASDISHGAPFGGFRQGTYGVMYATSRIVGSGAERKETLQTLQT